MQYKNILVKTDKNITRITINRPHQLNALNKETINELGQEFDRLSSDETTRVIILTGVGEKAFVAGADIKEFADFDSSQGKELSELGQKHLFDKIEKMNKPVIAAINGFALGGGLELAMSCHIRVASDNAKMGLPEVSLGVIPGYGGTQRLAQLVGKGKALEMITTASMIGSEEAYQWGLINHVTSSEELLIKSEKIATKISRNSSTAIHSAMKAVLAGFTTGINGYEVEIEEFGKCFGTSDFKEGTMAFLEKRKPNF